MRPWPLQGSPEQVKALLLFHLGESYSFRRQDSHDANVEAAIEAFTAALNTLPNATSSHLATDTRKLRADAYKGLGNAYGNRVRGVKADNIETAIKSYENALNHYDRQSSPLEWANTQNNLGTAYEERTHGSKKINMDSAITAYKAALTVTPRQTYQWAEVHVNLGRSYLGRISGSKSDNLEAAVAAYEAALTVYSAKDPEVWAPAMYNLGKAYLERISGERADNIERSIGALKPALAAIEKSTFPESWAMVQAAIGSAYVERIRGARADNLELAIAAYEAALSVRTREAYPVEWAATQNNLGVAYQYRIRGSRADNWERAIKAYEAALTVRTREATANDWAATQNNLGIAYVARALGNKEENIETAIHALSAALTIYTRESNPTDWASAQNNLGVAYRNRVRGSLANNLHAAIQSFQAALAVRTRAASPREWAQTQANIADAYRRSVQGATSYNLDEAIKGYQAALTVYTVEAFPREHLSTARDLAAVLLEMRNWRTASTVYSSARKAFQLLFGHGLDEFEAQELIAVAGPLFSESAYVAAQNGDLVEAFGLLAAGKARLMAVALRQESLELAPDKRARLAAIQSEIRELRPISESAKGEEGARALERLIVLRGELGDLVTASTGNEARDALAQARAVLSPGGAVVAPIITKFGGKILLLPSHRDSSELRAADMPQLTRTRLTELLLGQSDDPKAKGWLSAFHIQYLPETDRATRWPEWHAAVDGIGAKLWRFIGSDLQNALIQVGVAPGARIIWLPADALGLLPIGLTQEAAGKPRLGDTYEIVTAPSLEAMAAAERHAAVPVAPSLAIIINPTGDLPFTETEGAIVAAHFPPPAQLKLDNTTAEPVRVLATLKGKSYWHFSSHGTFDWSDVRRSGLLMKGKQPLTVQSLLDEQGRLGRPRLVVLSACETGLYDAAKNPDEFVGLPATFMQLGASGVLATLWQVDDLATALLVARFYELHRVHGIAPPTALKQAQAWLRGATKTELISYARKARATAKLDETQLAVLESTMKSRSRDGNPRFAGTWKLLQDNLEAAAKAVGKAWTADESLESRPFEHPIYWGAFVYMGV